MSKAYTSNLTQDQFELLNDLIPKAKPGGRPRCVDYVGNPMARFSTSCVRAAVGARYQVTYQHGIGLMRAMTVSHSCSG